MTHYFLFAGEASGDLHGSRLMQALRTHENRHSFSGVGGSRMRKEGLDCFLPMEQFQVMGFSDVLKAFPRLWQLFYKVRDAILKTQPDGIILIDYPGFNLRLAKALRKQGYKGKIVQYICPSIWAHGKKRIETLVNTVDLLLTIFPFEAAYFAHTSLRVVYIGNPIAETIRAHAYDFNWKEQTGLPSTQEIIALFPGSRPAEIKHHLPQQLQVAFHLKQRHPHLCFALSCAQESLRSSLVHLIQDTPSPLKESLYMISPQYSYELMRDCHTAIAKSGTVTLELALHGVPTVVHYQLSTLNYMIAKYILRLNLPFYCMVNILGNQKIFPELIGRKLSPTALSEQTEILHSNQDQRLQIVEACERLKQQLGTESSHRSAARAICELDLC